MPRRRGMFVRDVLPDPMYNSKVVTKFVNQIMWDGKKGTAQSIVYGAFDIIKEKTGMEPGERHARVRGQGAPRRRIDLPGPDRDQTRSSPNFGDQMVGHVLPQERRKDYGGARGG